MFMVGNKDKPLTDIIRRIKNFSIIRRKRVLIINIYV